MRKLTILATTAAVAINAISPAFATQLPSWSEVISKAGTEGGGWVRGHHSNTVFKPLAGRDGFIFGNVLADDIPLPRVTDVAAVLQAAKQATKPIIVASNEWLLPSNPMLCEIAEQVKMDCGDFTYNFYKYSQKDDDGNWSGLAASTAELEKVQAEVIEYVEAMGVKLADVAGENTQVAALQATVDMLKADAEANATTIAQLNDMIDGLEMNIKAKDLDITKLNEALTTAEAATKAANDLLADEKTQHAITQAAANEYKAKLQAEIDAHAATRTELKAVQAELAEAGVEIEELNDLIKANQKHINVIVGQKNEYYDALIQIGNNIGIAANSKNEVIDAVSALHIKYTSTAHDLKNEKIAHGLTQDLLDQAETNFAEAVKSITAATTEITSLKSDLNTANNMIDALQSNLDASIAKLATANVTIGNYEAAVETFEYNFSDYYKGEVTPENFNNKIVEAFNNYGKAVETDVATPLNAKIAQWSSDYNALKTKNDSTNKELAELNDSIFNAETGYLKQIADKDLEIKELKGKVNNLEHNVAGLESQLDAEKKKVQYWIDSSENFEDKWNNALGQIEVKDEQIGVLQGVVESRNATIEELNTEVKTLTDTNESLNKQVSELTADVSSQQQILTTMYDGLKGYYSAENEDNINYATAAAHVEMLKNEWSNAKEELGAINAMWTALGFDDDYAWQDFNWAKYVVDQFASLETQLATQKANYEELESTYNSLEQAVTEAGLSATALNLGGVSNYHYSFTDPANNIDGVVAFNFENNTPTASTVKLAANQLGGNNAGMHKLISLKVDGKNVWTDADLSTFSIHVKSSSVEELEKAVQAIAEQSYDNGYKDGYGDGYADGWSDAVNFINENK